MTAIALAKRVSLGLEWITAVVPSRFQGFYLLSGSEMGLRV
jgi:hypothetical protein